MLYYRKLLKVNTLRGLENFAGYMKHSHKSLE